MPRSEPHTLTLALCGATRRRSHRCPRRRVGRLTIWLGFVLACCWGCRSQPHRVLLDPISIGDAAGIANANVERIDGVLRASGAVDGWITLADGQKRSYHLDGVLFYLAPHFVRFDLKAFGQRQLLFGSNNEYHWYYDKEEDRYHCGRHGDDTAYAAELPAPPDQIIEILGLRSIPLESAIQRVVEDHQQILIVAQHATGRRFIQKEYWLDRYAPRLLRRMVFRNHDGVVTMESRFDDYARLTTDGPWLPHQITATWPQTQASMTFHIRKWKAFENLGPDSIQFALPTDCAESR